jgi:MFS family permease
VVAHDGGLIGGHAVSVGGHVRQEGGTIRGDIKSITSAEVAGEVHVGRAVPSAFDRVFRDVRTVLAMFVALAMLGFGTVFFGRRYLEVVADTATHAFGRSLVVGLLGQLLLLPTLGMLIVGLALTIVGILLLPFAVVAYAIAAVVAVVGGYLAVAHAIGETVARRRMARGAFVRAPNAYGYLFSGLVGLLSLWAAAALTGWMGPVVMVFRVAAVIVTWLAATVGFGAVLLARGGLRETFAGRHVGEMSDEYLWATPPATPAARRPSPRA